MREEHERVVKQYDEEAVLTEYVWHNDCQLMAQAEQWAIKASLPPEMRPSN